MSKLTTFRRMLWAGFIFGLLGPPIGAIIFVVLMSILTITKGNPSPFNISILPLALVYCYFLGFLPSVLTGVFLPAIVERFRVKNLPLAAAGMGLLVSAGFVLVISIPTIGSAHRSVLIFVPIFGFVGMVASVIIVLCTEVISPPENSSSSCIRSR